MWTRSELSELVMYSQCMPLEFELERMLVNLWWSNTNLNMWAEWSNTWVLIEWTRKTGIHLRFGASKHEVRNELYRIYVIVANIHSFLCKNDEPWFLLSCTLYISFESLTTVTSYWKLTAKHVVYLLCVTKIYPVVIPQYTAIIVIYHSKIPHRKCIADIY